MRKKNRKNAAPKRAACKRKEHRFCGALFLLILNLFLMALTVEGTFGTAAAA